MFSNIGVFFGTLKICSYSDRMAAVKVLNSDNLKVFLKSSPLLKRRLSRRVANGMFKEDKSRTTVAGGLVLLDAFSSSGFVLN